MNQTGRHIELSGNGRVGHFGLAQRMHLLDLRVREFRARVRLAFSDTAPICVLSDRIYRTAHPFQVFRPVVGAVPVQMVNRQFGRAVERFAYKAVNQKLWALALPLDADRKVAMLAKPRRADSTLPKLRNLPLTFRLRKVVGGADSAMARCFKATQRRDRFPNFHAPQVAREAIMDKVKRTYKAPDLYGAA